MTLKTFMTAGLFALGLAACGGTNDAAPIETVDAETPIDAAGPNIVNHGDHNSAAVSDGIGHGTGIIRSVGSQADFLTIEHGPLEGIDMGAMTMGFDIIGDVDLSGFSEGDQVAFMVKQGRDGSYRIVTLCNTVSDGDDCLDALMDH